MVIHKLDLDDFIECDFELLAIHSTLASYRMAYLLNRVLDVNFKNVDKLHNFDFFEYEDVNNQILWNLIANKGYLKEESMENTATLFSTTAKTRAYLIPEYKKVDFFIKIEKGTFDVQNIMTKINTIPQIITTFAIDFESLKSKNNLIFY